MFSSYLQVNKEDLLSMVRYGAELVFSSDAAKVTDAGQSRSSQVS
jgi:SWI/SNF-related matrix-associated actin-dependent regulator of chromatin subfamily A member 5